MAPSEADRSFARFVQTGDPEELGRVFDLTAPRLLVLALHLTRLPQEAEDLVQSTFVAAIESAAHFDRAHPVLPWLAGILANHSRRLLRRRATQPDPTRVYLRPEPEPPDAVGARELTADVVAAVGKLPEIYRTVLLLRLLHGLDPAEIGHTLGHPLETVRTRLRRGLALLRQALPRGLAVPVVAGLETPGLEAVRATVLAHAAAAKAPLVMTAMAVGGTLVMKKLLAVTAAVLALCTAFWFATPLPGVRDDSIANVPQPTAPVAGPAAAQKHPQTGATLPATRVAASEVPAESAASLPTAQLTGRCVAAESGLPLAGCVVTLRGWPSGDVSTRIVWDWGPREWQELVPVTTGADGRFAFAFAPPLGFLVEALASADGRMPARASWRWQTDAKLDVGDVRLPVGVRVRGRIVDSEGHRVADAELSAAQVERSPFGGDPGSAPRRSATSGADGTFDLGWLVPGTWRLSFHPCRQILEPAALAVPSERAELDVTLVVRAPDPGAVVSGTVVDPSGTPRSGIRVSASTGSCAAGADVSGPDGRFRIACPGDPTQPVCFVVRLPEGDEMIAPAWDAKFPWGTEGIQIVVGTPRPLAVDIQVLEADTRRPVEEFGVACCRNPHPSAGRFDAGWGRPRLLGRHPEGRLRVGNLAVGSQVLFVSPRRADLHLAGPIVFDLPRADAAPVQVLLHRKDVFRVRVRTESGTPVGATKVELLLPWGEPPPDIRTFAVRVDHLFGVVGAPSLAVLLDLGTTNADGIATLQAPIGQDGLALRLPGPGHQPKVLLDVRPEAEAVFDVVVTAGAGLIGRITPPDLVARLAQQARTTQGIRAGLRLRRADRPAEWFPGPGPLAGVAVGDDGSFHVGGIPAGTWDVRLFWYTGVGFDQFQHHELDPPLLRVTLRDGEQRHVELDASAWQPGRLHGRVLHEGKAQPKAEWSFRVTPPVGSPFWVSGPPADDQGRFVATALLPGSCQFAVRLSASRGGSPRWMFAPEVFQVGRGEDIEREFALRSRQLRIQLTESDGTTPVRNRRLFLRWDEAGMSHSQPETTDAQGTLVLDPPPLLPVAVELRSPDCDDEAFYRLPPAEQQRRILRLGTIDDDPTATDLRAALRLPEGIK